MKTAKDYLAAQLGPRQAAPFVSYDDALAAVQAVIDHYEPPARNVFPPACIRCTQRLDQCVCPPLFPPVI